MAKKKAVKKATRNTATKGTKKKTAPRGKKGPLANAGATTPPSLADLEASWEDSRKKSPQAGRAMGANPNVPDGDYVIQLQTARVSQYKRGSKKGQWFFSIGYVIATGELAGERLSTLDDIDDRVAFTRDDGTDVTPLDLLSQRLQLLGVDPSELKITEFPDVAQALSDPSHELGKPFARVAVQNKYAPNPNDESKPYHNQNVYVNELVDPSEVTTEVTTEVPF